MKLQLLLILAYILVLSASLPPQTESADLIEQICKKTPFYNLCVWSLHSNSQSSAADVKDLASIMANFVLSNATDTLSYIEGLVKQAKDPDMEKALAYCAEAYIPVVKYNIPQAIDALARGRYGFATFAISDAGKQADACEKGFSGSNSSPLTDRNKLLKNLCDVAVAIISVLMKL